MMTWVEGVVCIVYLIMVASIIMFGLRQQK